ncbi:MAG TPA: hypothetical protein VHY91_16675 [Pirellulales bacterium]|jgi:hypothetical protein|nr:hypothetical protein [Pirellulales bacterium]
MSARKGKNAVLIVTTPAGWKPTHWHAVPFAVEGAYFLERRLKLPEAIRMAKRFNKEHLPGPGGTFGREWALCVKSLKPNKWQGPNPQQAKGGGQ